MPTPPHVPQSNVNTLNICTSRLPDCENDFSHKSHLNGFTPLWTLLCEVNIQIAKMQKWLLTQITFEWFYSSVNLFMISKISRLWKWLLTQITFKWFYSHMNSFMWSQFPNYENDFSHKSHLNGFTPVWIHLYLSKLPDCKNKFSHISHLNGFTPIWVELWKWLLIQITFK